MTLRQKLYALTITFFTTFNSCNTSENKQVDNKSKSNSVSASKQSWNQMQSNSTKLVFEQYYLDLDSNVLRCIKCTSWSDSTTNLKAIKDFSSLFKNVKNGSYCCCPFSIFSVTFFRDTIEIGKYFVDTTTEHKALFFDGSYQTVFSIETKDWKKYLSENTNYR